MAIRDKVESQLGVLDVAERILTVGVRMACGGGQQRATFGRRTDRRSSF